jgi:hypothetical protein
MHLTVPIDICPPPNSGQDGGTFALSDRFMAAVSCRLRRGGWEKFIHIQPLKNTGNFCEIALYKRCWEW